MRAIVQRWVPLLGILISAVIGCSGEEPPAARSAEPAVGELRLLDPALQPLRRDFEAGYGQTRVVAVLSPTCGQCLENSRRLYETGVPRLHELGIEVCFVWGGALAGDIELRARKLAEEMFWPGLHHYFDESERGCRAFGRTMGLAPGASAYDIFFIYGPEATWDPAGSMDDEPADFNIAAALWTPSKPDHWWADPKRYPGFRRVWISEILSAVGADSAAGSGPAPG